MILNLQHWLQQIKKNVIPTKRSAWRDLFFHQTDLKEISRLVSLARNDNRGLAPILIIGVIAAVAIIGFSLLTSILNPVIKNSANSSNQPKYSSSPTEVAYLPTTSPTFSPSEEPAEVCSDCDEDLEGEDVLYADLEGED